MPIVVISSNFRILIRHRLCGRRPAGEGPAFSCMATTRAAWISTPAVTGAVVNRRVERENPRTPPPCGRMDPASEKDAEELGNEHPASVPVSPPARSAGITRRSAPLHRHAGSRHDASPEMLSRRPDRRWSYP
ncbi:hypothetical protein [Sphaerisporangium perillae]|uniref:hypothetical protein n=1 Tax=Sphaerisporangium perillae TaxID=2935860 RepID=UPI00200CD951|nr:hypothetical protein [Sphaerisporangium perillae]